MPFVPPAPYLHKQCLKLYFICCGSISLLTNPLGDNLEIWGHVLMHIHMFNTSFIIFIVKWTLKTKASWMYEVRAFNMSCCCESSKPSICLFCYESASDCDVIWVPKTRFSTVWKLSEIYKSHWPVRHMSIVEHT